MFHITVTITFPDATKVRCGEIITTQPDDRGIIKGAFRYTPEYLEHPFAFSLNPVELPLKPNEFHAQRKEGIHAVFEDALPDDWGRRLLIQQAQLPRYDQIPPKLLGILGPNGLGALSFEQQGLKVKKIFTADIVNLPDLLETAFSFDAGLPIDEEQLKILFMHGSSPGGARPKATIRKPDNSLWLAKFPRKADSFAIESMEAGCLEMAELAGLSTPKFELNQVGSRKVLLVQRFDISNKGGRYHMVSMQTLLSAEGYYYLGYKDIFEVLKKYSFQPIVDIPALFRQMVFNIAIGNTDDHLKNFCMLRTEPGFCLSPVYDLVPNVSGQREHTLSFPMGAGSLPPKRNALLDIGKKLNISDAKTIIDAVSGVVVNWKQIFKKYEVPDADIQRLKDGIDRRLNGLWHY